MYRQIGAFAFAIVITCAALAQEPGAAVEALKVEWVNGPALSSVYYPTSAADQRREGTVRLCCPVGAEQALNCRAVSYRPRSFGFQLAAVRASRDLRVSVASADEMRARGVELDLLVRFVVDPTTRGRVGGADVTLLQQHVEVEHVGVCGETPAA